MYDLIVFRKVILSDTKIAYLSKDKINAFCYTFYGHRLKLHKDIETLQ